MAQLLLEILSEEIPARMQARAAEDLKRLVCDGLKKEDLTFDKVEAYVTPRRLALVIDGLPEKIEDSTEERKGPQVCAADKAIEGFLKSAGLTSVDECEIREVKGKEFYFAVIETKGRPTAEVLAENLADAIAALPWPTSMRWGPGEVGRGGGRGAIRGWVGERVEKARDTADWLTERGMGWEPGYPHTAADRRWPKAGGQGLVDTLFRRLDGRGGVSSYETAAVELLTGASRSVIGVRCASPDGVVDLNARGGVVLACGGVQATVRVGVAYRGGFAGCELLVGGGGKRGR